MCTGSRRRRKNDPVELNSLAYLVLSLRNAYGRKVLQRHINKLAGEGNEVKLDVTALNLPSGIYYLHLTGQAAIRLVKK